MLALLIAPFFVMLVLWLIARHEAELSYYIIFFVVVGVSVAAFVASLFSGWLALGVYLVGMPFAIAKWCYVSLPKAALVTVLLFAFEVALNFAWAWIFSGGR